jgi:phosphoribosylformylglycinamidine cyclo-ligase
MGLTYKRAGVDIERGERFVEVIKEKLKNGGGIEQNNIGLFGGIFDLDLKAYRHPVIVSGTDGVGTKLLLAKQTQKYSTIGIDLVAMCVNDIITLGAKPLFFLDYIATATLNIQRGSEIIDGIIEGCRQSGCALLGGETAEMPGVYTEGDYELAGFAVGIAEKTKIIDGKSIRLGDSLVGLKSSGIHSNGLSLARKALFGEKRFSFNKTQPSYDKTIIDTLLIPTRIYVRAVLGAVEKIPVRGIAHITGGGVQSNIKRLLPAGLDVQIFWDSFPSPEIFDIIAVSGNINEKEMRKTFNMGIGLVFIVSKEYCTDLISQLQSAEEDPLIIGEVIEAVP